MTKEHLIEDYEYDEELFGDLNNSVPLHLYLFTDNTQLKDAFNNVLHKCFTRKELNTTKRLNDRRKHIRKIVLSLYKEYEDDKTKYITISLNNNDWTTKGRYGKLGMSLTVIKDVLARLKQKKFITLWKGKKQHNPQGRKQTRIRATEKLIDFMHSNKVKTKERTTSQTIKELIKADDNRYLSEPDRPRIILKDKDKNEIKIARKTDAVIESEEILKDYEDLLIYTKIYNPKTERLLTPYEKFQKRVFSRGRLDYNGRIHGGFWQNVSKDLYRKGITIDGQKTFEIDIKGTFPVLVYHLLGLDFWGQYEGIKKDEMYKADPYYLKGYTDRKDFGEAFRSALKLVFNAAINVNASSITKVSFALREKMKEEIKKDPSKAKFTKEEAQAINKVRGKMIREFLYKKHHLLQEYFFDERLGMLVMNQESRIVLRVLKESVNKKEPILSIFDSFIAKDTKENRVWLSEAITNAYAQEFEYRFAGFQTVK